MKNLLLVSCFLLITPNLSAQQRVIAANVEGKVDAVDTVTEESRSLKSKDRIRVMDAVNTAASSSATIVFSNGATIILGQDSSLVISAFLQNPFDKSFPMAGTTEEPSVSTLKLDLKRGDVICDVKKLRVDEGSSLTINTPVGAAGVRGTRFQVTYVPGVDGAAGTYTLTVAEGSVTFFNEDGTVDIVEAGTQIEITFTTREGEAGVEVTITGRRKGPAPQATLDAINLRAEEAEQDVDNIVFEPDNDVLELRGELGKALEKVVENINEVPSVTEMDSQ